MRKLKNITVGEILLEEFLKPLSISQNKLARDTKVPPRRINEIVLNKRSVTPDTSVRLAKYFNVSDSFFLGLQNDYDIEAEKKKIRDELLYIRPAFS